MMQVDITGRSAPHVASSALRRQAPTIALLVLAALAPLFFAPYVVAGITRGLIYGLAACAVAFTIRQGGMVSFGHAAYFGAGAYTVLVFQFQDVSEALVVWLAAAAFAALLGLIIGTMSLRTRGVAFIMITLGFAQMIYFILSSLQELGASDGLALAQRNTIAGISIGSTVAFHYSVLVLVSLFVLIFYKVSVSPFGLVLSGIRQNERRIVALGFDTYRIQLACFALSAAATGLAGALAANFYLYVSPSFLHWLVSGELLVMAALGGLTTLGGGLFGALLLVVAEEFLADITTYWRIILGPAVILVVLFFNQGLEPALRKLFRLGHD